MKIIEQRPYNAQRILTPASGKLLKIIGQPIWFARALVDIDATVAHLREVLHEVDANSVPRTPTREEKESNIVLSVLEATGQTTSPDGSSVIEWKAGITLLEGALANYQGKTYKIEKTHLTQNDRLPTYFRTFYTEVTVSPPSEGNSDETPKVEEVIAPFVQPTGSHDAYRKGTKIIFEGKIYESLIDNNAWSPSAYPSGWKQM